MLRKTARATAGGERITKSPCFAAESENLLQLQRENCMTVSSSVWRLERLFLSLSLMVLVLCGIATLPAAARDDEWVLLGEQRVQFPADRDVIRLSRRDGRFSAIALRVRGGTIRIFKVTVTYGNGEREVLDYGETVRDGDRTRPMDLRGEGRFIQEIELNYGAPPTALFMQPQVEVYGRVAADDRGGGRRDEGRRGGDDDESFFNREGKRASCDTYAKIAVVQAEAAEKYRCGLRGPQWNANERDHRHWCFRAPRQQLLADQRARSEALAKCFEGLGDQDYDAWRGGRR
jgi:hypothetical protein